MPDTCPRTAGIVLVVDQRLPAPDEDSGSVRLSRMIEELVRLGRQVLFFPLDGRTDMSYATRLKELGVAVLGDPAAQLRFLREQGHRIRLALLCRPQPAIRLLGEIRDHAPRCTVVYDTVDLHFRRLGRAADLAEREGRTDRFTLRAQAETTRALELLLARTCDITLVVSEEERTTLRSLVPGADVRVLSNIHLPPTGPAPGAADGARVLFVGHYLHQPNVDAARWLAREVMPLVSREVPEAGLDLVGSSAPEAVLSLAGDAVTVHGWVADLASLYAAARVVAAPLRFGAGVKGKVGEALEHGRPVVGTTLAFEGMGLRHGTEVLVGDSASELADRIVQLIRDAALGERLVQAALPRLTLLFGPARARDTLRGLLA
ncbi:glycosyltransferase family 4 protein [Streptomyces sp. CB00455]|uniref:glycosyltransferase family 4 protein n=1 Tax=Streptomyces sp. CB00455 TaxID=1703927 RepID=UPI00093AC278|nr:glycosyltransferase family 4 protein [Streptomyces sp. CB00455]